jgi:WXXGXW repeat (2 copies)
MRINHLHTRNRSIASGFALAILSTSCSVGAWAQQFEPTLPPPVELVNGAQEVNSTSPDVQSTANMLDDQSIEQVEGATPLMQGPIHEAFAERFSLEDEEALVITKEPPQLIDEQAPEYRPEGEDIEWIPGYWGWDISTEDFVWVSGVWRQMPPGQQWIPGYWTQVEGGWRWINGFWMADANEQIVYLPPPPQSIDNGPSTTAPGADFFWVTGNWLYTANNNYVWQSGHWHPCHNNWVWVPARYVWTPSGYVYRPGYWDFEVSHRGMLFAPVAFRSGFHRVYRPTYVIETSPLLFANLYVTPGTSCYYFGPSYARSARRPCYPWISYHRHGYDPLFSYYAFQQNRGNWLRGISTLQNQLDSMPNQIQNSRHTVADHLRLLGPRGPQSGSENQGILEPNAMLHVAALTALAAKSSQKVDFKTPFSVTQNNKMVAGLSSNAAQLNAFAKKRRELEIPSNPSDKANAVVRGASSNVQDPKSIPASSTLKQIELIKPKDKSRLPRDLKVGAGVNAKNFASSIGAQKSSSIASDGNTNNNTTKVGRDHNTPNVGSTATGPGAKNGNQPAQTAPQNPATKAQRQSQPFSQILSGDKVPLDAKQLEALRSTGMNKPTPGNNVRGNTETGKSNGSNSNQRNSRKVPTPPPAANLNSGQGLNPIPNANPGIGSTPNGANAPGKDNLRSNKGLPGNLRGGGLLPSTGADRKPGNNTGLPAISNPPNLLPPIGNGNKPPVQNPGKPNNGVANGGFGNGGLPGLIPGNNGSSSAGTGSGRPGVGPGSGGGRGVSGNGPGTGNGGLRNAMPNIGRSLPGTGEKALGGNNKGSGAAPGPNAGGNRSGGKGGKKDGKDGGKK